MSERANVAVVGCALAVLVLVLLPCVVPFLPAAYFDVDPRSEAGQLPTVAFGPAGTAWYQAIAVLVAAVALAVSVWAGAVLRWGACALVAVGAVACAYHLPQHASNALPIGGWLAAAAMGLAAVHLGQFEAARRWLMAGLVAVLAPMALQAVWYVLVDHAATVASYLATEAQMLESRGWEEGSPQHALYRRRLMDWQAVGAFGLSNVFGSVVAGFTLAALAVVLGVWRRPGMRQWAWMLLPVVGLGAVTVVLSRSAGAVLALPAGALVLAAVAWAAQPGGRLAKLPGGRGVVVALPIALVVLAFAAVLVRGAIGPPETMDGERTVLFRFQYWQAAARLMVHDLPGSAVVGVGPEGFQQGYLWAKNPLNPEEVTSAHNVFVDYVAILGMGGWAFAAVLLLWLGQGALAAVRADRLGPTPQAGEGEAGLPRGNLVVAAAVAGVVFGVQYTLMLPTLVIESALLWLAGALAFVGVMAVVAARGRWANWWGVAGLLAAATTMLVHNQIEMTFYQYSAAPIAWLLVGLAAGGLCRPGEAGGKARLVRLAPAGAMAVVAVVLMVGHAGPTSAQQTRLAAAARALQQDRFPQAVAWLDAAGEHEPTDATVWRWRVGLRLSGAHQAAGAGRTDVARQQIDAALAVLDASRAAGVASASLHRHYANTHTLAADLLAEPGHLDEAIAHREQVTALAPYSLNDHVELGDLLWDRDDQGPAVERYRRALQISRRSYLDPVKQLPEQEEHRLEVRVAAYEAAVRGRE